MADTSTAIDYKTADIDGTFPDDTAILFGADNQVTATPGPYLASAVADAFDSRPSTLTNKTLITPQIASIFNGALEFMMPAAAGTLARLEDIGAGSYTSPMTTRGEMLRRGASADEAFAVGAAGYALMSNGTDPAWTGYTPGGSGAATLSWTAKAKQQVSVLDFGAVGDGVTDDTAAVQAALVAFPVVHFGGPQYEYKIAGTLTLANNQRLDLRGARVVQTSSQTPLFDGSSKSGWVVENGIAQGHGNDYLDSSVSQAIGVKTNGASNCQVRNMRFEDFCYSAVAGVSTMVTGLSVTGCTVVGPGSGVLSPGVSRNNNGILGYGSNIIFAHNDISETGQGIYIAQESSNVIVANNNIHDIIVEHGMYLDSGIQNMSVTGNTVRSVYSSGIKFQFYDAIAKQPQWINISGNVVTGATTGDGILINNSIPGGTVYRVYGLTICGNSISEVTVGYAINLRYAEGCAVTGNAMYNNYGGIYVASVNDALIASNIVRFTKFNGFVVASGTFVTIKANKIYDPGRNGSVDAFSCGILISNGDGHSVTDNEIVGNSTRMQHGILVTGGTQSGFVIDNNVVRNAKEYGMALVSGTAIRSAEGNSLEGVIGGGDIKNILRTVSALPAVASVQPGTRRYVTDATGTTFRTVVAGGGANKVGVMSDGSNWLIA